jgi:hypothetical protein
MGIETVAAGIGALGTLAGGGAQIAGAAKQPEQQAPQASMQIPQAPSVLPLPQLGVQPAPQNDLYAQMLQLQGGPR